MDQDQSQQPPQQPTQQQNNELEDRLNEMAAVVAEMRRQQSEMQNEMQRQADLHEAERKKWHEECRQMQEERERLLKQGAAAATQQTSPKPCKVGLLMSSRVIGSKPNSSHSPNRVRSFHSLPDGFRKQMLALVQAKRQALASQLQKYKQAVETDQTTRALDTLSLSENKSDSSSATSSPKRPLRFPSSSGGGPMANLEGQFEDISKQRRMQQQLAAVLHAQNCNSEQTDSIGNVICPVPLCTITTKVLEHIRTCTFVTRCPVPTCSVTREVIQHYKNCKKEDCEICRPAKQESVSTQEQLLRFMDTICKGLDDEAPIEAPTIPSVIVPPYNPIGPSCSSLAENVQPVMGVVPALNPFATRLISLDTSVPMPMFLPTLLPSRTFVGHAETKKEEDIASAEVKMEGSDTQEGDNSEVKMDGPHA